MARLAGDLGQLVVSVGTDLTELNKGLKSADSEVKGFAKSGEASLLSFKNVAIGAATAAGAAIVGLSVQTFKYGQELHRLSVQTGISAQDLARLKFIAEDVDSSFEALVNSIKFISRAMYESVNGNKELADIFKRLGINVRDAEGNLRDAKDVLYELGPATQRLGNETEALAILMKITGRSALELQGFMKTSKEEMNELRTVNINANEKLNEFAITVDSLSDKFNLWKESGKNWLAEFGLPFLKWLDQATEKGQKQAEYQRKNLEALRAQPDVARFLKGMGPGMDVMPQDMAGLAQREGPGFGGATMLPGAPMEPREAAMQALGGFTERFGTGKGQRAPAGFSQGGGEGILGLNFGDIMAKMEELKVKWGDVSKSMAEVFGSSVENIATGFGAGVAGMIVDGEEFGEAMKTLFKDFAREAISQILAIIAQQTILFAWQVITGTVGSGNLLGTGGGGKKKFFGLFREGGLMPQARAGLMTGGHGEGGIPVMAHPNEVIAPIDKVFAMMQDAMGRGATFNVYPAAGMSEERLARMIAFENDRRKRRP